MARGAIDFRLLEETLHQNSNGHFFDTIQTHYQLVIVGLIARILSIFQVAFKHMAVLRNFTADTSGAVTVQWIVLTASVVAIATLAITIIFGGVTATSTTTSDQVTSIAEDSIVAFKAPPVVTETVVEPIKISVRAPLSSPFIAWMDIPDTVQCENAYDVYGSTSGQPTRVCRQTADVIEPLMPDWFFIPPPRPIQTASCNNPSNVYYHLVDSPRAVCLQSSVTIAIASPSQPADIHVAAISTFQRTDPCEVSSNLRYRRPGAAAQGCKFSANVIVSLPPATQPLYAHLAKAPAFNEPKMCLKSDCQFARKSEAKPQHSYFAASPALLTPVRCSTPPCVFSRPKDTPLAPSQMLFAAPDAVFTR